MFSKGWTSFFSLAVNQRQPCCLSVTSLNRGNHHKVIWFVGKGTEFLIQTCLCFSFVCCFYWDWKGGSCRSTTQKSHLLLFLLALRPCELETRVQVMGIENMGWYAVFEGRLTHTGWCQEFKYGERNWILKVVIQTKTVVYAKVRFSLSSES